jgi:hypothetical protein
MYNRCKNKSSVSSQATGKGSVLKSRGGNKGGVSNSRICVQMTDSDQTVPARTSRHCDPATGTLSIVNFFIVACLEGLAGFDTPSSKKVF